MGWLRDGLDAAVRIAKTQLGVVKTFDDGVHPQGVHSICVRHGWYIDGISVEYRDGSVCSHGNSKGGEAARWTVPHGEYICKVLIRAEDFVDQLVFVTNRGNTSPVFGGTGGRQRSEGSGDAMLLGMRGSGGGLLADLRFYWGQPVAASRGGARVTLGFSSLSTECVECGKGSIATRYKPCGHAVLCEECASVGVLSLQDVHDGLQTPMMSENGSVNQGAHQCPVCGIEAASLERLAPVSKNAVMLEANARRSLEALMFRLPLSHGGGYAIATGAHQFTSLWLRDFCRASHGILAAGMLRPSDGSCPDAAVSAVSVVSGVLSAFLSFVVSDRPDGLVPRVLDYFPGVSIQDERENAVWWKVVHGAASLTRQRAGSDDVGKNRCEFPAQAAPRLHAMYKGESGVESTIDSNYLLIRAFARLAEHLDNAALVCFAEEHGKSLRAALSYYAVESRWMDVEGSPMLLQEPFSEWKDSLLQHGASSFTNLELIEAYESVLLSLRLRPIFAGVALNPQRFGGVSVLSLDDGAIGVITEALAAWKREVVRVFLRPDVALLYEIYPVDEELRPALALVSHLDAQLQYLTVTSTQKDADIAGLVSIDSIMAAFSRLDVAAGGRLSELRGIDANSWPGPEVDGTKSFVGMRQYHGTMMWSWLAGWLAHRAVLAGRKDIAELVFEWLRNGQEARFSRANFGSYIGEVHEPTGEAIATLLYTSETPFCWGSGYVLAAVLAHRASSA